MSAASIIHDRQLNHPAKPRMGARRPLRCGLACALLLSLLTGCVATLAPARPLLAGDDRSADQVAVAVQSNSVKHYVWTACDGDLCRFVYQRLSAPSYQYSFTAPSDVRLQDPDVAVTVDGRAFVVYRLCNSVCTDYYSIIPASADNNTPIAVEQLAAPIGNSAAPPKLKARDHVVYATYVVSATPAPRLRYRQLSGGTSGGYVELRDDVLPSAPSLAIGTTGALYVTWQATTTLGSEIVYGTNNGTDGDFGATTSYEAASSSSFRNPDIALDPRNTPYIVYAYNGGASDVVKIICEAAASACFGNVNARAIALNSAQNPWRLRGNPHIQVLGTSPAVVFAADNTSTDNNEIWYYAPPSSGLDPGPVRVTNNAVQDDEPQMVVERSNFNDVPVVAWRTYTSTEVPPRIGFECFGDAYMFYFTTSTTQRVFSGTGGCSNSAQDLAANGPWIVGVWLDRFDSSGASVLVPWSLFNARTSYAPIASR